jgi:predicted kinase
MTDTGEDVQLHPKLIIVSGQAGSGKTTLAHQLAQRIGCPAICRDEIKEGMVHAHGDGFEATTSDPLTRRTFPLFFDCVRLLLEGGVTVVAEAAFQHRLWSQGLAPLLDLAELRIVRCATDDATMLERRRKRFAEVATRSAHADSDVMQVAQAWDAIHLELPTLDVDTTDGYAPGLDRIAAFVNQRS